MSLNSTDDTKLTCTVTTHGVTATDTVTGADADCHANIVQNDDGTWSKMNMH